MKNINDYIIDNLNQSDKEKAFKAFDAFFNNFDFNSIPASERNKDPEDFEKIAKLHRMASEASLDDDVL